MKQQSLFLQFNNNKKINIIDFLIENKGLDFSKKQIIEGANISRASLFNAWPQLEEQEIVKVSRQFGKTKLYTLNSKNPIIKKLLELESVLIGKALENRSVSKITV